MSKLKFFSVVTISGQTTNNGNALPGASVNLSGSSTNRVRTNSSGNYSFIVAAGNSFTIMPTLTNYTFTPASMTFSNLSLNATANFTSMLRPTAANISIGGRG